jgi:hypothetical protein
MSRGLGRVERAILDFLEKQETDHDTYVIAAIAFAKEPDEAGRILLSDAELAATRRALAKLKRIGKVYDLGRASPDGRRRWCNERIGLRATIRRMQVENMTDPRFRDAATMTARIHEMLPLLRRAKELGVEIH